MPTCSLISENAWGPPSIMPGCLYFSSSRRNQVLTSTDGYLGRLWLHLNHQIHHEARVHWPRHYLAPSTQIKLPQKGRHFLLSRSQQKFTISEGDGVLKKKKTPGVEGFLYRPLIPIANTTTQERWQNWLRWSLSCKLPVQPDQTKRDSKRYLYWLTQVKQPAAWTSCLNNARNKHTSTIKRRKTKLAPALNFITICPMALISTQFVEFRCEKFRFHLVSLPRRWPLTNICKQSYHRFPWIQFYKPGNKTNRMLPIVTKVNGC